jgi:cell division protein FtsI (penicillin-binding protein 3)
MGEPDMRGTSQTGRTGLLHLRALLLLGARQRLLIVLALFVGVATIMLVRTAYLGFVGAAPGETTLTQALLPPRGEITDRNGAPLARTHPAYALSFNPQAMEDEGSPLVGEPAAVAAQLRAIFPDLKEKDILAAFASKRRTYIRRRILPEEANRVYELGEVALEVPRERDRHYPQGALAAHILGFVREGANGSLVGRLGMEEVLEERLSDPARRAEPTALSIDLRVQGALEDELGRGMLATDAKGAAGIVLDVDTGEVLALASLPQFDPNRPDAQSSPHVFNRATNGTYELGSTFKPITMAAAIDAGLVRDLSAEWDAGPLAMSGRTFRDYKPKGKTLNIAEALAYSSNVVTMRIADALGPERLRPVLMDLGMNARAEIELPARGKPQWPAMGSRGEWSRLTNMTVSYGHGIAVTPLHLANAYAAIVNGGIYRPATLMKVEPGGIEPGRRVFKASTSSRMRQLLRMIAIYGTGRSADATGFRVGGKTGSAEKAVSGGYARTALISSFAAAFPMDKPRYVVVTVLDEPRGTIASSYQRTAAWNAAPIAGRLIPRIGPMLGVRPDERRDVDISDLAFLIEGRR